MKISNILLSFGLVLSLVLPAIAMAQDVVPIVDPCYTLDTNDTWKQLFSEFSAEFTAQNYQEALVKTQKLQEICDRSPVLNFSIATTYRELGDYEKASIYLRNATENTKDFNVSKEMLLKMWYARYEIDNASVMCKREELDSVLAEKQADEQRIQELNNEILTLQNQSNTSLTNHTKSFATVLWTGVGLGTAGLIMGITGGVLLADVYKDDGKNVVTSISCKTPNNGVCPDNSKKSVKLNSNFVPAWAILGVGIGMTAVGAAMAGVGGYFYSKTKNESTYSFQVGPGSFEFGMTF